MTTASDRPSLPAGLRSAPATTASLAAALLLSACVAPQQQPRPYGFTPPSQGPIQLVPPTTYTQPAPLSDPTPMTADPQSTDPRPADPVENTLLQPLPPATPEGLSPVPEPTLTPQPQPDAPPSGNRASAPTAALPAFKKPAPSAVPMMGFRPMRGQTAPTP